MICEHIRAQGANAPRSGRFDMRLFKRKFIWWTGSAVAVAIGAVIALIAAQQPAQQLQASPAPNGNAAAQDESESGVLTVKTILPKCDPSFSFSVQEPASVTAYYLSELDAQVAGQLQRIRKAEGSPITAGELLAKIAVTDLEKEVALKEAVIKQTQEEQE